MSFKNFSCGPQLPKLSLLHCQSHCLNSRAQCEKTDAIWSDSPMHLWGPVLPNEVARPTWPHSWCESWKPTQRIPHSCLGTAQDGGWQGRLNFLSTSKMFFWSATESTVCKSFPWDRNVILICLDLLCTNIYYISIENKGEYVLQYVVI